MASPGESRAPNSPASPAPSGDWTVQVADTIESIVSSGRDKTAVPLETVARALVYGILVAVMGTTAMVLVTIALVRAGSYLLPVWAVYAATGGLFCGLGLLCWRWRRPKAGPQTDKG